MEQAGPQLGRAHARRQGAPRLDGRAASGHHATGGRRETGRHRAARVGADGAPRLLQEGEEPSGGAGHGRPLARPMGPGGLLGVAEPGHRLHHGGAGDAVEPRRLLRPGAQQLDAVPQLPPADVHQDERQARVLHGRCRAVRHEVFRHLRHGSQGHGPDAETHPRDQLRVPAHGGLQEEGAHEQLHRRVHRLRQPGVELHRPGGGRVLGHGLLAGHHLQSDVFHPWHDGPQFVHRLRHELGVRGADGGLRGSRDHQRAPARDARQQHGRVRRRGVHELHAVPVAQVQRVDEPEWQMLHVRPVRERLRARRDVRQRVPEAVRGPDRQRLGHKRGSLRRHDQGLAHGQQRPGGEPVRAPRSG
mmetsp:Transcript_41353/g.124833  ORF Transcript_41353/g.124833 Transcript_41353/m.124833 type:complete len:360 (-) Transcript_41353:797-1876(-)